MPADADAPPDLVTPLTARPACSASRAICFELLHARQIAVDQIEIGKGLGQLRFVGEPGIFVFGRDARHRHRALGQYLGAVARHVVGRDHRLAAADQHAQAEIVAFRAFAFLDLAVAHLDRLRQPAHRDRVGGIGAGGQRRLDQPLGPVGEGGLVEQGVGGCEHGGAFVDSGFRGYFRKAASARPNSPGTGRHAY